MHQLFKTISLHDISKIAKEMNDHTAITKINQYIIQRIARTFNRQNLIQLNHNPLQHQLFSLNVIGNVETLRTLLDLTDEEVGHTRKFMQSIYTAFHNDELCDEYIQHWRDEGLEAIGGSRNYYQVVYKELTKDDVSTHTDSSMSINPDAASMFINGISNALSKIGLIPDTEAEDLQEAIMDEIDYISAHPDISFSKTDKLTKYLLGGKLKKYAKKMRKLNISMHYLVETEDGIVTKTRAAIAEHARKLAAPRPGILRPTPEPVFKESDSTLLLEYNPSTTTPGEREVLIDKHFIENGVVYEAPLSFSKAIAFYQYQLVHNLMTPDEVVAKANRLLQHIVGEDLSKEVKIVSIPEGIAISMSNASPTAMFTKMRIMEMLQTTTIPN